MINVRFLIFGVIWLICNAHLSVSQSNDHVIEDLRNNWKTFDHNTGLFVPHVSTLPTNVIYFEVDHIKHAEHRLKLNLKSGYSFYVNEQLIGSSKTPGIVYLTIDSLSQFVRNEKLSFSIYSKDFSPQDISSQLVTKGALNHMIVKSEHEGILLRNKADQYDLFVTISIFVLAIIVILRTINGRIFSEYFSLSKSLRLRPRFEVITSQSIFSFANLSFVVLYSLLVTVSAMNLFIFSENTHRWWNENSPLTFGIIAFAIAFVSILLKRSLIEIMASVFNFTKIVEKQFFTYFRLSLLFFIVFFMFSILNGILEGHLVEQYFEVVIWSVLFILWARVLFVYLVLNSELNFHKLHLFTYLCSAEIIPLVFFLKFLIK